MITELFFHIFLIWTEIPFIQKVSSANTSPFLDTYELKMALRARKVSGAFEKQVPDHYKLTWHEPAIQSKISTWSAVNFKKHKSSMSSKPEPVMWSGVAGQWIPCFDRCQLSITWMSNIKYIRCKPRLQDLVLTRVRPPRCVTSSLGARARNPCPSHVNHEKIVAWVSISMHACDPVPIVMVFRLVALRAAGAPLWIRIFPCTW